MSRIPVALLVLVAVLVFIPSASASAQSEISAARAEGKTVFVVVSQANARGTDVAMQAARQAHARAPKSAVVFMDRAAPENQALVKSYGILGAPVPLVLVVASNGVVAGGSLLKGLTADVLLRLIPTPKKADMLLHLSQKLPVFVVVSRKTMVDQRSAAFEACNAAMQHLQKKAATVVVDMDDKAEKAWLKELNIAPKEPAPVIIVFNAKGEKAQVFRGPVTPEQLVAASRKKAPCCPGGSC